MTTRTTAQTGKPGTSGGSPPKLPELLCARSSTSADPTTVEVPQDRRSPLHFCLAGNSKHPRQPDLQPTAQIRAGISYLQRVLDGHDYTDLDERVFMIERVGLNPGNDCTVAEFGSAELLGRALNEDRVCEMHEECNEYYIVGREIEVYYVLEDCWISAFVAGECDEGYLLMFFDGVVERVSLTNKAWRLVH